MSNHFADPNIHYTVEVRPPRKGEQYLAGRSIQTAEKDFTSTSHPVIVGQQSTKENTMTEQINWLHSLIQELENAGTILPMGDYMTVYAIIETIREKAHNNDDE